MGGGKGGGGGDTESTIRYAPYIEAHHKDFLSAIEEKVNEVLYDEEGEPKPSPYADFSEVDINPAFFGVGYTLSSFPSLYDMYGKFMAGLDVEVLFDQVFEDTIDGPVINNLVSAEADRLSDELTENGYPEFEAGMRDINSVMSSSFVIGKGLMETARLKAVSRFSAEMRYKLLPVVSDRWKTHLDWNHKVTGTYMEIIKLYLMSKIDTDNHNFEIGAKNTLWPFTVLEYKRAALGTLNQAQDVNKDVSGASTGQKVLGGAMSGAAAGWMVGGPVGAGIGGVLGAASGLF